MTPTADLVSDAARDSQDGANNDGDDAECPDDGNAGDEADEPVALLRGRSLAAPLR